MLGLPVPGPAAKDYTAFTVTDALLGGTFGSRITTNIREEKGYTYSPYSYLDTHRAARTGCSRPTSRRSSPARRSRRSLGRSRACSRRRDAELDGIKNNMIGLFTLRNGSRGGIMTQLVQADLQGLGDDYLSGYVKRVMAVTPEEVRDMTKKYIVPDRMTLVVVGDKATVAAQIGAVRAAGALIASSA